MRPQRLTYIRVTGPYDSAIPEAWTRMMNWLEKNGLHSPVGRGYGLARDNPQLVGAENCRYDACIPVMPLFEDRAAREMGLITLPAGPYTRLRHAGGYEPLRSLIGTLHGSFHAPDGLKLDERRPVVTIYLDDPRRMDPLDLRADVCIPVCAARLSRDPEQAAA